MSVGIDEQGTVTVGGRPVDYATAYGWAVDSPETITELVRDTKAFVTVIAAAEDAGPEEQAAAVRQAFVAGVPREPGATWSDAEQQTTPEEPEPRESAPEEPEPRETVQRESLTEEPEPEESVPQESAAGESR